MLVSISVIHNYFILGHKAIETNLYDAKTYMYDVATNCLGPMASNVHSVKMETLTLTHDMSIFLSIYNRTNLISCPSLKLD